MRSIVTVVEQVGRDQRLQRRVARGLIISSVGRGMEIGADGLGIDAPVAFDVDASRGELVGRIAIDSSRRLRPASRRIAAAIRTPAVGYYVSLVTSLPSHCLADSFNANCQRGANNVGAR